MSKFAQALNVMPDFDVSKITVSDLKLLGSGAKLGFVNYNVRGRCGLETPEVYIPFDCRKFEGDGDAGGAGGADGPKKASLTLSLKNRGEDDDMDRLLDVLQAVDDRIIQIGVDNAIKWGIVKAGKKVDRDIVDNVFNPSIKHPVNKETGEPLGYPPQLRVKFPEKDGVITTEVYNQSGQRVYFKDPAEVFRKGMRVRCILECTGLWCSQKFGLTWKITKAVVQDMNTGVSSIGFSNFKPTVGAGAGAGAGAEGEGGAGGDTTVVENEYDVYDKLGGGGGGGGGDSNGSVLDAVSPAAPAPVSGDGEDEDDEDGDDMPKAPVPSKAPTRPAVSGGAPVFGRKRKPVGAGK